MSYLFDLFDSFFSPEEYYQTFASYGGNIFLGYGIIFTGAAAAACLVEFATLKGIQAYSNKKKKQTKELSLNASEIGETKSTFKFGSKGQKILKALHILEFLVFVVGVLSFSIIPSSFSGFGVIGVFSSMILTLLICLSPYGVYALSASSEGKEKVEEREGKIASLCRVCRIVIGKHPIFIAILIIITILYSIAIPLMTMGLCRATFNADFGYHIADAIFSSSLTRTLSIPEVCPPGPPCHVYASIPEDPSSYIFINVHTNYDVQQITVLYDTWENYNTTGYLAHSSESVSYQMDFDWKGKRTIHSALLQSDDPATLYRFEIFYDNATQYNGTFKTLPSNNEAPITMILGGDVGNNITAQNMTASLSKVKPDVIFVGGDAAYDNGLPSCWYSWDLYLNMFERLNEKLGYTVPMVIGVGNHDVGWGSNTSNRITPERIPTYIYYFPQHFELGSDGYSIPAVPDVLNRRTYFYHKVGNTIIYGLDSLYNADVNGTQNEFLTNVSLEYADEAKFAYYHVPTYPACLSDTTNPPSEQLYVQEVWAPQFEKFKFKAIFENHQHLFKKTFPLVNGTLDKENGVIYFGDGNWGIPPSSCSLNNNANATGIFEVIRRTNHVWVLKTNETGYEIYPVNTTGTKFYASTYGKF